MPAQANIVINDGQGTPVAHTFVPNGAMQQQDKKVMSEWVDRSPAVKAGYFVIREQHAPSNANRLEKVRWLIQRPTTETPSGATSPQLAYENTIVVEAWIHDRATSAETADMAAFLKNFAALSYVSTKITTRERTW